MIAASIGAGPGSAFAVTYAVRPKHVSWRHIATSCTPAAHAQQGRVVRMPMGWGASQQRLILDAYECTMRAVARRR